MADMFIDESLAGRRRRKKSKSKRKKGAWRGSKGRKVRGTVRRVASSNARPIASDKRMVVARSKSILGNEKMQLKVAEQLLEKWVSRGGRKEQLVEALSRLIEGRSLKGLDFSNYMEDEDMQLDGLGIFGKKWKAKRDARKAERKSRGGGWFKNWVSKTVDKITGDAKQGAALSIEDLAKGTEFQLDPEGAEARAQFAKQVQAEKEKNIAAAAKAEAEEAARAAAEKAAEEEEERKILGMQPQVAYPVIGVGALTLIVAAVKLLGDNSANNNGNNKSK